MFENRPKSDKGYWYVFGRYAEHALGFQLYFALNGRPHVGTRDATGRHVCLHTREPLVKADERIITGIRSKGRLWLSVDDADPICAEASATAETNTRIFMTTPFRTVRR